MRRPDFHLRRYQLMQMAGDGLLVALSYFLAFQLRFLDDPGTIPERYVDLFPAVGRFRDRRQADRLLPVRALPEVVAFRGRS